MTVCTDTLAHGYLHGEPLDPTRHRIGSVVKGATYHQTALTERNGVHEARLIVDV
jgi:SHS2 domain-containing protein